MIQNITSKWMEKYSLSKIHFNIYSNQTLNCILLHICTRGVYCTFV